jgi:hypothetical protein
MSALLLLLTTAFLAGSAGLITASLRLQGPVAFLLGVYLIGYGELVVLVALLSPAHLVVRAALVPALGIMLAASVLGWRRAGRPSLPRGTLGRLREALRDPPLAFLGIAVALAFGYLTALALWTPPNSWDALWYHLPRAAFWKQEHGVGYINLTAGTDYDVWSVNTEAEYHEEGQAVEAALEPELAEALR